MSEGVKRYPNLDGLVYGTYSFNRGKVSDELAAAERTAVELEAARKRIAAFELESKFSIAAINQAIGSIGLTGVRSDLADARDRLIAAFDRDQS